MFSGELQEEREKLETIIKMQKEIAALQHNRQEEHDHAVEMLSTSVTLIKELVDENRKLSALKESSSVTKNVSISAQISERTTPLDSASPSSPFPCFSSLEEDIRSKEDLREALNDLVRFAFLEQQHQKNESETTSGASSDMESEFEIENQPFAEENDKSVEHDDDSGAESTGCTTLTVSRRQLDRALTQERFNLSRVYYTEYEDSLRKALAKLNKARELSSRKMQNTEKNLINGIDELIERVIFEVNHAEEQEALLTKQDEGSKKSTEKVCVDLGESSTHTEEESSMDDAKESEMEREEEKLPVVSNSLSVETHDKCDDKTASNNPNETNISSKEEKTFDNVKKDEDSKECTEKDRKDLGESSKSNAEILHLQPEEKTSVDDIKESEFKKEEEKLPVVSDSLMAETLDKCDDKIATNNPNETNVSSGEEKVFDNVKNALENELKFISDGNGKGKSELKVARPKNENQKAHKKSLDQQVPVVEKTSQSGAKDQTDIVRQQVMSDSSVAPMEEKLMEIKEDLTKNDPDDIVSAVAERKNGVEEAISKKINKQKNQTEFGKQGNSLHDPSGEENVVERKHPITEKSSQDRTNDQVATEKRSDKHSPNVKIDEDMDNKETVSGSEPNSTVDGVDDKKKIVQEPININMKKNGDLEDGLQIPAKCNNFSDDKNAKWEEESLSEKTPVTEKSLQLKAIDQPMGTKANGKCAAKEDELVDKKKGISEGEAVDGVSDVSERLDEQQAECKPESGSSEDKNVIEKDVQNKALSKVSSEEHVLSTGTALEDQNNGLVAPNEKKNEKEKALDKKKNDLESEQEIEEMAKQNTLKEKEDKNRLRKLNSYLSPALEERNLAGQDNRANEKQMPVDDNILEDETDEHMAKIDRKRLRSTNVASEEDKGFQNRKDGFKGDGVEEQMNVTKLGNLGSSLAPGDKNVAERDIKDENVNNENVELLKELNRDDLESCLKFLRNLVGNNFVEQIPELQEKRDAEGKSNKNKKRFDEDELAKLHREKESVSGELKNINEQLSKLKEFTDDKITQKVKEVAEKELETLKAIEKLEETVNMLENKDTVDYLIIERTELKHQLDDRSEQVLEKKESLRENGTLEKGMVGQLMLEEDELKERMQDNDMSVRKMEKELDKLLNEKETDISSFEETITELSAQVEVLNKVESGKSITLTKQETDFLPLSVSQAVKEKLTFEEKAIEVDKKIKAAEKQIERYERMIQNQNQKSLPVKQRIQGLKNALEKEKTVIDTTQGNQIYKSVDKPGEKAAGSDYKEEEEENIKIDQEKAIKEKLKKLHNKIESQKTKSLALTTNVDLDDPESILDARQKLQKDVNNLGTEISEITKVNAWDKCEDLLSIASLIEKREMLAGEIQSLEKQIESIRDTGNKGFEMEAEFQTAETNKILELLKQKEKVENRIERIESQIFEEQDNFLDSLRHRNKENVSPSSKSTTGTLLAKIKKLNSDLKITKAELEDLEDGGCGLKENFKAVESKTISKKLLEHELEDLHKKLHEEPKRSAGALASLIEEKEQVEEKMVRILEMLQKSKLSLENKIRVDKKLLSQTPASVVAVLDLKTLYLDKMEENRKNESNSEIDALQDELNRVCNELRDIEITMKENGMKLADSHPSEEEKAVARFIELKQEKYSQKRDIEDRIKRRNFNDETLQDLDEVARTKFKQAMLQNKFKIASDERTTVDKKIKDNLENINEADFDPAVLERLEDLDALMKKQKHLEDKIQSLNDIRNCLIAQNNLQRQMQGIQEADDRGSQVITSQNELESLLQIVAEIKSRERNLEEKLLDKLEEIENLKQEEKVNRKCINEVDSKLKLIKEAMKTLLVDVEKEKEQHLTAFKGKEIENLNLIDDVEKQQQSLFSELSRVNELIKHREEANAEQIKADVYTLKDLLKEKQTLRAYLDEIERQLEELSANISASSEQEENSFRYV